MFPARQFITFAIGVVSLVSPLQGAQAADDLLAKGWNAQGEFSFNEAQGFFKSASGLSGAAERERKLGEAVALLNVQPRTQGNIARASTVLQEVVDAGTPDKAESFARFYLARIAEIHQTPADLAKARAIYLELLKSGPTVPIAEYGASKIVLIDLYDNITPEEFERRMTELEKLEPFLKTAQGRREFHANIGIACAELGGPNDRLLKHLIAADEEGFTQWQTESIVWLLIADAAEKSGDKELARKYYQKFSEKYKRDNRFYAVMEKLKRLETGL